MPAVAFYVVADLRHFIGAVALLNSLRLVGHDEPVFVVDAGLTDAQRIRLAAHVTFLSPPTDIPPVYMAPLGPLARPSGVAIVVDADIIALKSFTPLVASARQGRVVGFVNDPPNDQRFFGEWADRLGLIAPLRRRPYLNAGFFLVPRVLADRLLEPWLECQQKVNYDGTRYGAATMADPFYFADQDVVNALFSAELRDDELECMDHRLAPHTPLRGVRVIDKLRLVCEYPDGTAPYLLHHAMAKPWLQATVPNAYSQLLPRLLLAPDVAVRLSPHDLPLRLRSGTLAHWARFASGQKALARQELRRQLGRFGIRTRLREWRSGRPPRSRSRSADHPPTA